MNIHEYQAKEIMRQYNIAVLKGGVADTPAEAVEVAKKLGEKIWRHARRMSNAKHDQE